MRIDAFLSQSPMFAVYKTARRFEALVTELLAEDEIGFLDGLTLAALFFEAPAGVKPSQLAEVFATSRGNISHCISSLEARGYVQRRIDPDDARAYLITLKPAGKRCAMRVIAAFDSLQNSFERKAGKPALAQTIATLARLEGMIEE